MNISLAVGDPTKAKVDLLVLPLFETDLTDRKSPHRWLATADKRLKGLLSKVATQEGFKARLEQSLVLHTHGKLAAERVLLIGVGARTKARPEALRLAAGRAVKLAQKLKVKTAAVAMPEALDREVFTQATVEGLLLGAYRFDRYRTTGAEERKGPALARVQLFFADGAPRDKALTRAIDLGRRVAQATNWARDLVNEPAGVVTPSRLAEEAAKLAEAGGLKLEVLNRDEIAELKMGMFLAVARGSVEEPKLIHLSYTPTDPAHRERPPVALIGKAITFDSGGLSLKTADGMVDMKTDMAGAAAVLGAMQVIAALEPPFPVHALMGACENMPAGNAYRPGDILFSRLGKTVEITNTDAEGRLVLGDVLAYANDLGPAVMIDLATLTGACMVALGHYVTGAFGDDDAAMNAVLAAGQAAGEDLWRLPISEHQKDALRSDVADMKNSGERWGSAINAAVFLREFVGQTPWVHLDIAGPSQSPKDRGYYLKGATGVGVRTLVAFIRGRTQQLEASA